MGISNDIRPRKPKQKIEEIKAPEGVEELPVLEEGEEEVKIRSAQTDHDPFSPNHNFLEEEIDDFFVTANNDEGHNEPQYYEPEPAKSPHAARRSSPVVIKIVIVILIILLIVILVKQNLNSIYKYFGLETLTNTSENTNNPYENINPQDYTKTAPNTSGSSSSQSVVDAQEAVVTGSATTSSLNRASISLSLLNGNGIKGSAASVKSTIETAGYTVSNLSNAKVYTYPTTTIYYKSGKEAYATDLKSVLSSRTTTVEASDSITGNYDIVIVIGAK